MTGFAYQRSDKEKEQAKAAAAARAEFGETQYSNADEEGDGDEASLQFTLERAARATRREANPINGDALTETMMRDEGGETMDSMETA